MAAPLHDSDFAPGAKVLVDFRAMAAPSLHTIALSLLLAWPVAGCNSPVVRQPQPVEPTPAVNGDGGITKLVWRPRKHPATRDLAESLALPEAEFDLALSLILFSRDYGGAPDDSIDKMLAMIDQWQERLNYLTRHMRSMEERVDALRSYIHNELEFRFDSADPRGHSADNLMFHRVLERRRGYCATLSMVYLLLAPAADVRLAPIRLPSHFAVLDLSTDPPVMLETTNRGLPVSRTGVYTKYRISVQSVEINGVFFCPITGREVFSTLYSNLAAVESLKGNDAAALEHATRAIELSPSNVEARYNRSTLLAKQLDAKSVQESLREVNEAIRLDPNFYRGYTRRAAIKAKHGDRTEAMNDLQRAKNLRADLPHAHIEEGVIKYGDGDVTGAKACFEEALKLDATNPDALRNLSAVELELGNVERARELEGLWRKSMRTVE